MAEATTPMMKQYRRLKSEVASDIILLFRLGDFYEMFFEDAQEAAPILDVALTKRNNIPMCGVPHHAIETYLAKLVRAGKKIAICDQVEDASASKGIVRREVTRIVTAGTITEDNILESDRHNFLAGICRVGNTLGFALLDLSTGLFQGEELEDYDALRDNLRHFAPTECAIPSDLADDHELSAILSSFGLIHVTSCEDWTFDYDAARDNMIRHFGIHSLEGFGCEGKKAVVGAAGGILYYVREDLRRQTGHIRSFQIANSSDYLLLDESTCGNLDLVPVKGKAGISNLLKALDVTRTAMGGRKLRDWLLRPLANMGRVVQRHDVIEAFHKDKALLKTLREELGNVRDLERLIARIGAGSGNARDIWSINQSVVAFPVFNEMLSNHSVALLKELGSELVPMPELVDLIEKAIADEPPVTIMDGGIIRSGYNQELDELRGAANEGRKWLAEYQAKEQERTGIKTLKVRHNRVFGYYIEVSRGQSDNVPPEYTRKQTLVNAERFITPELKEYENKIFGADDKAKELEYEMFLEVRDAVIAETERIQSAASALARLDILASLADRALALRYVRPKMTQGETIMIKGGRHPVIEQMPDAERFVPNDTTLDCSGNQVVIITGPNMAGKSTYIRQVALISIMAQMGSFVPADEAEMGIVDRVFTRVGASDDLVRGRSTFMVEMQETANILNNATSKSLIVLDEIGRGTSTFDGISIAWAVAEYLHDTDKVKAKTLFATHYHELTDLALTMKGIKNYNVLVREKDDKVVFLRKIVEGSADKSYGIQVARLAGLPAEVITRSKEILANLEEGEFAESGQPKIAKQRTRKKKDNSRQMDMFGS